MAEMIPFLDLKAPYAELKEQLDAAYRRVMESGWYILGRKSKPLKRNSLSLRARHCVGGERTGSFAAGADGGGCRRGDEVIVPSNTYIASWLAVTYGGESGAG